MKEWESVLRRVKQGKEDLYKESIAQPAQNELYIEEVEQSESEVDGFLLELLETIETKNILKSVRSALWKKGKVWDYIASSEKREAPFVSIPSESSPSHKYTEYDRQRWCILEAKGPGSGNSFLTIKAYSTLREGRVVDYTIGTESFDIYEDGLEAMIKLNEDNTTFQNLDTLVDYKSETIWKNQNPEMNQEQAANVGNEIQLFVGKDYLARLTSNRLS